MKSLARKHRYFEKPKEPRLLLDDGLEALLAGTSAPDVCARGLALVQALRAEDFVGTAGDGDDAHDIYEVRYPPAPARDSGANASGRRLRVGLMPYHFDGQPLLLMIRIEALPDADQPPAGATR